MIHTTRRELDVPLETRSLAALREFVREVLAESRLGQRVARMIVIGIDEACTSIILNAREQGATGNLRVRMDVDPTRVKVHIADTANDFDVARISDVLSREELLKEFTRARKHELGTFLIRRVMDEFTYTFKRGFESEIEMIKFLYEESEPEAN